MSLINDALKKAQKRHAPGPGAPLLPPTSGGTPAGPAGRGSPFSGQLLFLCALGAAVLVALSVVGTVYLLRRPAPPGPMAAPTASSPAVAAVEKPSPPPVGKSVPPAPAPAAPLNHPPVAPAPPAAPPVTAASPPAPTAAPLPPTVALLPAVPATPPPLDPSKPDPKIAAYIDALQVAGVRITSAGGKVLMNDRVYRQNDIVDRLLGVRLKKIEDDSLIFVDERGVTYTKNF